MQKKFGRPHLLELKLNLFILSYLYCKQTDTACKPSKDGALAEKGWACFLPHEKNFAHPRIRTKDAGKQKGCCYARLAVV